jgi:uncharacterized membrane protein YgcG
MAAQLNFCTSSFQRFKLAENSYRKMVNIKKEEKKVNIFVKNSLKNSNLNLTKNKLVQNIFPFVIGLNLIFNPTNTHALPDQKPQTKVIDESGVLTKSSISYIEKTISKIKDSKQEDVFFILVRSLPYEKTAQEYAQELFQKWNLGEKDVVVVLASKIAKGGIFYGSEIKTLSETIVKSIGEETFPFKAKEEQYSSAALDVSNRLFSILTDKGDPGPPVINRGNNSSSFKSAKNTEEQRSKYIAIIVILLVIAFVVPMFQFFFYVKDE